MSRRGFGGAIAFFAESAMRSLRLGDEEAIRDLMDRWDAIPEGRSSGAVGLGVSAVGKPEWTVSLRRNAEQSAMGHD